MSEYLAPLKEMRFVMQELAGLDQVVSLPGCEEASPDVVDAILEEAARFSGEVLSPLNRVGDRDGAKWKDTVVTTSPGFKEAYRQFVDNGWNGLGCDPEFGGQGLPKLLSTAVSEMWKAANHAFSLCPMLTQGAIEALMIAGTDEQKAAYLPNLVSGEWTGTMNLTEPSAGSDLAAVRSRAEPVGDGTYKVFGQKIFITYGEHDMTDNIVHLVLARTPNAPEGVKGISLFVVPKFLLKADGTPGERNDVYCVSIEHKLGIHGSPTAVLAFGDHGGAIGTLVGEENRGLEYMFIMMNAARFNVGLEGLGDAERAYQRAVVYAKERVQGTEVGVRGGPKVPIIKHPDVRRMLLSMRARIEAMRALAYVTAAAQDNAHANPDAVAREKARAFADLLIPVVKGWSTESAIDIASLGVQVHGGMGYIEETGAAQHLRDARITAIYEGTTAIQANDLIGRKIAREKGATILAVIADMRAAAAQLDGDLAGIGARQQAAIEALEKAVNWLVGTFSADPKAAHAGAVPFLYLFGIVAGGWQMGRAAVIARSKLASGESDPFWVAKLATTRFYADHFLTQAAGLAESVVAGAAGALELADDSF
ncbi:acyl-CoA dehydrogenase [Dechloromonas sp. HYN0024]|uniref:acyl-CoA dehydrogenase n=1 Tax=Dechloromonas sp. HYN0024 TaxID=2231055 RepID=UPI000E4514FB|nr:acyl-CoA dehydrogenase [Dechloromonas sp. HYN0024]AXS80390.1 acyl-CoA dehydrogenase [Dechloromonas sp. HYN0024]